MNKEENEKLRAFGKTLQNAKKTAFRIDYTRPNAEVDVEILDLDIGAFATDLDFLDEEQD